ncbi:MULTISPECIES: AraC family transcriptional regulator [Rhizobium/Agrobacterium group]|uniref:AraC family transcriptional regulator n=1 Tax=Rhizobium/Agrobacterium group TaxID=227290 RepID=UPI000DCF8B5C|nr:AraC family transcriptional regulator [Rhizobium sp. AN88]MDP9563280.1 AraC-like DNA-binding protein [Rhizobium nepotum]
MDKISELAHHIDRHVAGNGLFNTLIPRLSLVYADQPVVPMPVIYEAGLCLIAQGSNRVVVGDNSVVYDAAHYLVVSVDLPLLCHITEASPDKPYLCCKIDFDRTILADLIVNEAGKTERTELPALAAYPGDPDLIDAACRLVRLLNRPETVGALAPLIEREILYRLLNGPHGPMLRHVATAGSQVNQISRAIAAIRRQFDGQIRIEDVAAEAGMSPSSLHAHFKAVTHMTPLEYQKQLRLQEARRLMLVGGATAATAGFTVGYESPSQFSREYRRLFGAPPRQDIEMLNASGAAAVAF